MVSHSGNKVVSLSGNKVVPQSGNKVGVMYTTSEVHSRTAEDALVMRGN